MSDDPKPNEAVAEEPAAPEAVAAEAAVVETEGAAAETPAVETPASSHDEPTFLEQAAPEAKPEEPPAADAEKPAEPAKPDEAKPEEAKPEVAAAEPVTEPAKPEPLVYDPLVLPEGVSGNAERLAEFDAIIAPHQVPPEARDQLRDLHIGEMQRYAGHLLSEQHRIWGETRKAWRDQIAGDEELGGSGIKTTEGRVARMRDMFVPAAHRTAFDDFLRVTGAGDHPEFIRLLNNLGRFHDEAGPSPTPAGPAPDRGGGAGRGRRLREVLYDHPRSQT